jgi:hypothetical protein
VRAEPEPSAEEAEEAEEAETAEGAGDKGKGKGKEKPPKSLYNMDTKNSAQKRGKQVLYTWL